MQFAIKLTVVLFYCPPFKLLLVKLKNVFLNCQAGSQASTQNAAPAFKNTASKYWNKGWY